MLNNTKLYRYTSGGEGIFSAGKRLLPEELVDEARENRKWLSKPDLPKGKYRFYLTKSGKEKYDRTLLHTHRKYLTNILLEEVDVIAVGKVVHQDEWQVVVRRV